MYGIYSIHILNAYIHTYILYTVHTYMHACIHITNKHTYFMQYIYHVNIQGRFYDGVPEDMYMNVV